VLRFAQGSTPGIVNLFEQALADLQSAGAELVMIEDGPNPPETFGRASYDLLKFEFKEGINQYLASTSPEQVKTRNLTDLIAFNSEHKDIELALFDQSIFSDSLNMDDLESKDYLDAKELVQTTTRDNGIDHLLATHQVDVLIAPSGLTVPRRDAVNGDVWPNDWPGYGSHAAKAGYPHLTVPMGTVHALPVGLSFIGKANDDAHILGFAYAYEQQSQRRAEPSYWQNAEQIPDIAASLAGFNANKSKPSK
jgi:amidase